jgi:hypothetical protein
MRMQNDRRPAPAEPAVTTSAPAPNIEAEYTTPEQLAKRWHVSPTTIRRWFKDEPDVLVWGTAESRPGRKRAHLSMRIPAHVVERVRRRMVRD